MTRLRLAYSRIENGRFGKLSNVPCRMLPAKSCASRETLSAKVEKLERLDPDGAVVIDRLVDDLLAEATR